MPGRYCPHNIALWESPVGKAPTEGHVTQPSELKILQRLGVPREDDVTKYTLLSVLIVCQMFKTRIPDRDSFDYSLAEFQSSPLQENIALALRALRLKFSDEDEGLTLEDKEAIKEGLDAEAKYVQEAYEYLKTHATDLGNPFYQWSQIFRLSKTGGKQCKVCWREKEKIESMFLIGLGMGATREGYDDDSD